MEELLKEKDYFKTSDICLATTLCCFNYKVEAIDKNSPKAVFFIKRDDQLDNLIGRYFAHQLQVEPLEFFSFTREIKTRLYNYNI